MTNNRSVRIVIGILYNRTKKPSNPSIYSHFVGRILYSGYLLLYFPDVSTFSEFSVLIIVNLIHFSLFNFFHIATNMTGGHLYD